MKVEEEQLRKFNEAYEKVFTAEDEVKLCGRVNCQKLIEIANLIEKDKEHGSILTGRMNIHSLVELKDKIRNKKFN